MYIIGTIGSEYWYYLYSFRYVLEEFQSEIISQLVSQARKTHISIESATSVPLYH